VTALSKFFKTTIFRWSLAYILIFVVGSGVVIGFLFWRHPQPEADKNEEANTPEQDAACHFDEVMLIFDVTSNDEKRAAGHLDRNSVLSLFASRWGASAKDTFGDCIDQRHHEVAFCGEEALAVPTLSATSLSHDRKYSSAAQIIENDVTEAGGIERQQMGGRRYVANDLGLARPRVWRQCQGAADGDDGAVGRRFEPLNYWDFGRYAN